ncbi:MAG: hypothetical protein MZV70_35020 [Desulfobacterales bacterium]|nr:hypothetical protein [Desulfobacterales bacterium]
MGVLREAPPGIHPAGHHGAPCGPGQDGQPRLGQPSNEDLVRVTIDGDDLGEFKGGLFRGFDRGGPQG